MERNSAISKEDRSHKSDKSNTPIDTYQEKLSNPKFFISKPKKQQNKDIRMTLFDTTLRADENMKLKKSS